MNKHTIILIGGTSHAGKTMVARALSQKYNFDLYSTDRVAKHPGRPWTSPKGSPVPAHVEEHYSSLDVDDLLLDVLDHYGTNVIPRVRDLVQRCESGLVSGGAVIEGSALWPEFVGDLVRRPSVAAIWLITSPQVLQQRIYAESKYATAGARQKHLIDKFLQRTLAYSERMQSDLGRLDFPSIAEDSVSPEQLLDALDS